MGSVRAASLSSSGADMNVGEQILFEGAGANTQINLGGGLFRSSTASTLTLNTASPNISQAGMVGLLTVVSGTGATETTQITGYTAATGTYTFQTPLAIPLDGTSVVSITQAPSQVAVVNNNLSGAAQDVTSSTLTASAGVEFYPGGANVAVDGNTFTNLVHGVSVWSFGAQNSSGAYGAGQFAGASFFAIDGNTFKNVNAAVSFIDGYPTDFNLGVLSAADNHRVVGTTIQNNNFAGVNTTVFAMITNGGGAVDVAADNVASNNTLPTSSTASLMEVQGFDNGSPNLLIFNNQSAGVASELPLSSQLPYSSLAFPGASNSAPQFEGYFLPDGSFAADEVASVSGTYQSQPALIANAVAPNSIGVAASLYPWIAHPLQVLNAGAGNNVLIGSSGGQQVLNGGAGNDVIVAATGAADAKFATATMTGGAGADTFVFVPGSQYASNTVTDFNAAQGDKVVVANLAPAGVNPFTAGYLKITTTGAGSALLYSASGNSTNYSDARQFQRRDADALECCLGTRIDAIGGHGRFAVCGRVGFPRTFERGRQKCDPQSVLRAHAQRHADIAPKLLAPLACRNIKRPVAHLVFDHREPCRVADSRGSSFANRSRDDGCSGRSRPRNRPLVLDRRPAQPILVGIARGAGVASGGRNRSDSIRRGRVGWNRLFP